MCIFRDSALRLKHNGVTDQLHAQDGTLLFPACKEEVGIFKGCDHA